MKRKYVFILGIIVGAIIFGSIGVYATLAYSSAQIRYKETTVEEAINTLYDRSDYLDEISNSDCVSGIYHHNANTQWNIDIPFQPNYVTFEFQVPTFYAYVSYNKNVGNKFNGLVVSKSTGTMTGYNYTNSISVTSSKLTTNWATTTTGGAYQAEYDAYYRICK